LETITSSFSTGFEGVVGINHNFSKILAIVAGPARQSTTNLSFGLSLFHCS